MRNLNTKDIQMSKKDDTQEEIGKMQIRNSTVDFLVFTKDSNNYILIYRA